MLVSNEAFISDFAVCLKADNSSREEILSRGKELVIFSRLYIRKHMEKTISEKELRENGKHALKTAFVP